MLSHIPKPIPLHFPIDDRIRAPPQNPQQVTFRNVTCLLYNAPCRSAFGSQARVGAMTKEKKDDTGGGKSYLSDFCSQILILGMVSAAIVGIYWLFPQFWENYHIPLLLIAAGVVIPTLFSLWKWWAGYGFQVGIAPGLAFILMGVFIWLFEYDIDNPWSDAVSNLFWTNVAVLLFWFAFLIFLFRRRQNNIQVTQDYYYRDERWRDYRWIIAPAVLILLFLFDTSWAQSTLSISSLKKSTIKTTPLATIQIHAEYPSQILFNETSPSEIHLWTTGSTNCADLEISADGLLFAVKPPTDTPLKWDEKLTLKFDKMTTATTLLVQPSKPPETDSKSVRLNLISDGNNLTKDWQIIVESKRDSQIRDWKKNFLGTGSTIVSLITAIFVGIKQLEEEKKRRKNEQIKEAISNFEADVIKDFSKALQKHLELSTDWNEWDNGLQEQFRKVYASFVEEELWEALAEKTIVEMQGDVALLCQVYDRIFKEQEKPVSTLLTLQSALRMDENSPRELLTLLEEHPASINTAKIIARSFPLDLKMKTRKYGDEFSAQIQALRLELDLIEESFPLQKQYSYYAKEHAPAERLTAWLRAHELNYSPFADADSPFYLVIDKQFIIELAMPRFALPTSNSRNVAFEFANAWDAGAALFEFCITLRDNVRLKDDIFFLAVTPGMVKDYGTDHPRKLLLHALAEQWIWSLAEEPTLFYSLERGQRELTGRLLRWHDLSPSITINKIAEIARHLKEMKKEREKEEKENQTVFFSKITEWLTGMSADDLRMEEINALIGLRPSPKQRTLFLISIRDLNPHVAEHIPASLHQTLSKQADWLSAHNCGLVSFCLGGERRQKVSHPALVNQCNIRVQKCSKEGNLVFNELFDAPSREPDAILAEKADGSPGRMVRLGQKLLMQHVERYSSSEPLHIEDLEAL